MKSGKLYMYRTEEITKKVYNKIVNSIKLQDRMDTKFMNSENSKTSNRHRLLLNLSGNLKKK